MKNINPKDIENNIFREFKKIENNFIATNNFYVFEEDDHGKFVFSNMNNNKIISLSEDIYILCDNNNQTKTYLNLILLSNISLTLEDVYISSSQLIKNMLASNEIDEKLFEDLYFNEEFAKKINLKIPDKYNDKKINNEDNKYLFKININELKNTYHQYMT